jgi:uncharacterized protein (TIGR02118 family)
LSHAPVLQFDDKLSRLPETLLKVLSLTNDQSLLTGMTMAVKLVVIYPHPKNIQAFETVYNRDHVPMAVEKLAGKTKIVATRVLGSPQGKPAFHRIAEIHFPSMEALEACAASEGGKQTLASLRAAHQFFWLPKRKHSCFEEVRLETLKYPASETNLPARGKD